MFFHWITLCPIAINKVFLVISMNSVGNLQSHFPKLQQNPQEKWFLWYEKKEFDNCHRKIHWRIKIVRLVWCIPFFSTMGFRSSLLFVRNTNADRFESRRKNLRHSLLWFERASKHALMLFMAWDNRQPNYWMHNIFSARLVSIVCHAFCVKSLQTKPTIVLYTLLLYSKYTKDEKIHSHTAVVKADNVPFKQQDFYT